jgi:hypothetical protein
MPFGISAAGAAAIGAGASAGAGILGGIMQSNSQAKALAQQKAIFEEQRNDLAPYRTAGGTTLQDQQDLLGLNGQDAATAAMAKFQQSPGYQWQLGQGLRAVDAGAAASGMLRSGATLKAEQTYGSGLADQDFSNYYSRLMGISTLGENAAAGGASTANAASSAIGQNANQQSSIYGNVASGLGNTVNSLFSNPNVQSWLSGGVSPSSVSNNALYQQGAFAAAGPGAYGPFQ